jgi:hypothetical protein
MPELAEETENPLRDADAFESADVEKASSTSLNPAAHAEAECQAFCPPTQPVQSELLGGGYARALQDCVELRA